MKRKWVVAALAIITVVSILHLSSSLQIDRKGELEDLIFELKTDKDKYETSQTITIQVVGFNPTKKTIKHRFLTPQRLWGIIKISNRSFSKVIYNSSKKPYSIVVGPEETYPPSNNTKVPVSEVIEIHPLSSFTFFSEIWNAKLKPGTYQIETIPQKDLPGDPGSSFRIPHTRLNKTIEIAP